MNQTAVIYCRVSSPKQVREGHGLESQETRCREYAKFKQYEVIETFSDDGVTGGIIDRPGMQTMLAFLRKRKKESCVVIIDDISRLARGLEAHLDLRSAIAQAGGKLESPSIEFGDDSDSRLVENLLASVSQHQRQKNAEQVVNRMRARSMNGYWVACPIFGYRYESVEGHGKMLVRDEPVATIVKEALEGFAYGRFETKTEVKWFLEKQPAFPKDRKGEVHLQRVHNMLKRLAYAGYLNMPDWGIHFLKAKHEPLITLETWQKIQDRLGGQAKAPIRKGLSDDFPLRGFVLCEKCGWTMTSAWSKGRNKMYPYYFCDNKKCSNYRRSIRKEKLEKEFEQLLGTIKPPKPLFDVIEAMFRDFWDERHKLCEERTDQARIELKKLERQEQQFLDRLVQADNPSLIVAYENRVKDIGKQKLILREKIERKERPQKGFDETFRTALDFVQDPQKLWAFEDIEAQKIVLRLVFEERLVYSRNEGFRTAVTSCPFRVFSGYPQPHSLMVHHGIPCLSMCYVTIDYPVRKIGMTIAVCQTSAFSNTNTFL